MKFAEHGAVDRGESCPYNRNPAKQRVKKEFLLPENSASGRMPGRNGNAVCVDQDDGRKLLFAIRSASHSDRKARRLSGIVGIYHRNGALLEQALLQSLVDFLSYRGPDSRECWMDGSIGLGHAMLRTTHESLGERQPASLAGRFWITADARLDGRAEFIAELQRSGRVVPPNAPDSELLLEAYAIWGTQIG